MQSKWNMFVVLALLAVLIGGGILLGISQLSSFIPGLTPILVLVLLAIVLAVTSLANQFFK